jgi:hypothetical protein
MKFGVVLSEQPIFVENKSDIAAHMMNSVQWKWMSETSNKL